MISRFHVENFKALRNVNLSLTPIHVLIGPNDSGKTSLLEAMQALCRSVDFAFDKTFVGPWDGGDLVWNGELHEPVRFSAELTTHEQRLDYSVDLRFAPQGRAVTVSRETITAYTDRASSGEGVDLTSGNLQDGTFIRRLQLGRVSPPEAHRKVCEAVREALSGVHYYRWHPRMLSLPVAPDLGRQFRMDSTGFGLALCLDDILGYDYRRYMDLETRFKDIFPEIASIRLVPKHAFRAPEDPQQLVPQLHQADGKGILFELTRGGPLISASQASDGMLLILAYLAVLHLPRPPRVLLVEEPENGIHPGRLLDILSILRTLVEEQSSTQIVMTTHSPYVVDHFQPDEVTLCAKNADGAVKVRRLSESQLVREQMRLFTLGEVWTGEGDAALLQPAQTEMHEQ